jgi:hypothetical protein
MMSILADNHTEVQRQRTAREIQRLRDEVYWLREEVRRQRADICCRDKRIANQRVQYRRVVAAIENLLTDSQGHNAGRTTGRTGHPRPGGAIPFSPAGVFAEPQEDYGYFGA